MNFVEKDMRKDGNLINKQIMRHVHLAYFKHLIPRLLFNSIGKGRGKLRNAASKLCRLPDKQVARESDLWTCMEVT
jgi:hypothetical protein